MARLDHDARALGATLLLIGPRGAGASSLLRTIRARVPAERRPGDPARAGATADPLLDWLPLDLGVIGGWQVRVDCYAVSSRSNYDTTRRVLLEDADGLMFVLDSQAARLDDNLAALRTVQEQLLDREGRVRDLPQVCCYTKQDLPEELLLAPPALDAALNPRGAPSFAVRTLAGDNVLESLHALVTLVMRRLATARRGTA